jgi:NTE family protein
MAERAVAFVLGGGGARGLAHIGVLEALEEEGIRADALSGTSIGGLVAALLAMGMSAVQIAELAHGFRLPRRFLPGRLLEWDEIFRPAVGLLDHRTFADLQRPLAVSAVDLLAAEEVVLQSGPLLPAVRATCAMPGVLVPEPLGDRQLVDGGVVNILPVDLAWLWDPGAIIAVNIVAAPRRAARVDSAYERFANALGRLAPNPLTAHVACGVALRAVDVALERQRSLAVAMTSPDVLIDVDVGDVSIGDFHRLDEVIRCGRRAGQAAIPQVREALATAASSPRHLEPACPSHVDPVCHMVVSPGRARAVLERDGVAYYFCSTNCRDLFARHGARAVAGGLRSVNSESNGGVRRGN